MSLFLPRRPQVSLPFLYPAFAGLLPFTSCRYESTARRTTKRLRTKPDSSFTSSIKPEHLHDYIVFNPPSSAPSPYHTPPAFLPSNDPRRKLLAQSHQHANPYTSPDRKLPPMIKSRIPQERRYHLTEEDFTEIRRLRSLDPYKWTKKQLAEKFDCSENLVAMLAPHEAKRQNDEKELERIKLRWGKRKRYAREDRQKRKDMWGRDD
ncbi:hypothetical protein MMC21_001765 [Puttea exsequens]|nr:hypothetical protein [Puttea exsequens]